MIFSFTQQQFADEDYHAHLKEENKTNKNIEEVKTQLGNKPQAVMLRVVRFAGGQAAGAGGILELVGQDKPLYDIYKEKEGLHLTQFSPGASYGKPVIQNR
ncbi:MAG: hypothetical protein AB1797_07535 [bacterium]